MTTLYLALSSAVIPTVPLVLAHAGPMAGAASVLLLVCAAGLWFERDRARLPKPVDFGDEERLAA